MSSYPFERENEQYDADSVTLVDEYGRSLECYVEHSLEWAEMTYLLLLPVDLPIIIMALSSETDDEDVLEALMLEDQAEMSEIFSDAKAVLAEQNLFLKDTAYTLTVTGELPPLEEDKILTLDLDEEDSQLEPEELQFLASFYHAEKKYSIYTPLTPLLFFARYNLNDELELVSPDDEQFQPILEELLFEELE